MAAKAADHLVRPRLSYRSLERNCRRCERVHRMIERMNHRLLGRTGFRVSEISFGAWAIGGSWGHVDDSESMAALHAAVDAGVNFIDTADVYGMGRSERLVARLREERKDPIVVATKAGRKLPKQTVDGYSRENLTGWIEESLSNLKTEALDLVQLHCPPTELYYRPEIFGYLDDLQKVGKIQHYGVSVERVEEALKAIEYPNLKTVQIIFNCFRQRPAELFFQQAEAKQVGMLARVPLASGLLTGKFKHNTQFESEDHRNFNRKGEAFDVGETFSGVDYGEALQWVEQIRPLVPPGQTMSQFALRWILMHPAVTCAIPGGKRPSQVAENCEASALPPLSEEAIDRIRDLYLSQVAPQVHQRW